MGKSSRCFQLLGRRRSQRVKAIRISPRCAHSEQPGWKWHSPAGAARVLDSKGEIRASKRCGESSWQERRENSPSLPPSPALPFCFLKEKGTQDMGPGGGEGLHSTGDTTPGLGTGLCLPCGAASQGMVGSHFLGIREEKVVRWWGGRAKERGEHPEYCQLQAGFRELLGQRDRLGKALGVILRRPRSHFVQEASCPASTPRQDATL